MKNLLLLLCIIASVTISVAQPMHDPPQPPPSPEEIKNKVYTIVDQMPEFPGGEGEMLKFLGKNVVYPAKARDCNCQGTVIATFVVAEDGSVQDARISRGVNCGTGIKYYDKKGKLLPESQKDQAVSMLDFSAATKEMADETLRVINLMPKWTPGMQDGKPVKVLYNIPIKYTLQ